MKKLKELIKKVCTKEVILYGIFGIFTTIVNLTSFYILTKFLHWEENISNIIAILLAVIFAYITNKDLVFHSDAKSLKEKTMQFVKFMSGRAFTMVVEWVRMLIAIFNTNPSNDFKTCNDNNSYNLELFYK